MPPNPSDKTSFDRGSLWHRWDPHIHAPGTLLNDQFGGEQAWSDYLARIEHSAPRIRALGVTDYCITDTYVRVREEQLRGRLPSVDLLFPNVELRLDIGTDRGRRVNVHLLVSPEDPEHLDRLHHFLARLQFRAHNEAFYCTRGDLIRLGRRTDSTLSDEKSALRHGANQFKVPLNELRKAREESDWAQSNILVAIPGSRTDGTSGVRQASDTTLRQEMEAFAHVIFASSPAQREFWLGRAAVSPDQIRLRYGGLKPCLHGSDAHELTRVGKPEQDRFCWLKGDVAFDTLRHACMDPENRAFVGPEPPDTRPSSQVFDQLSISTAPWAQTPEILLNPGLVAVIGARGSGKTALAEMIARACDAIPAKESPDVPTRLSPSFLSRAGELLGNSSVALKWQAGESSIRRLDGRDMPEDAYPRARYLSQQFVDQLCSANSVTDALLREIERIIFEAHPRTDRDGALNFAALLKSRASRYRLARAREEKAISDISERIATEMNKHRLIDPLAKQIAETQRRIAAYTKDRQQLLSNRSQHRVTRLTEITEAADKVRSYLRYYSNQEQSLLALQDEVKDLRTNTAPEMLRRTQERHSGSRIKPKDWEPFLLDYAGNVDAQLTAYLKSCRKAITYWTGTTPRPLPQVTDTLLPPNKALDDVPLATLEAAIQRLGQLVNADRMVQKRFTFVSEKIGTETATRSTLENKLKDARGARSRVSSLQNERIEAYKRVVEAITNEEQVLVDLYQPLLARLSKESDTLKKMTFAVSRAVDIDSWADFAETQLVDLRRQGPFRGRGRLRALAEETLRQAWETDDSEAVAEAMAEFRRKYQNGLVKHALASRDDFDKYQDWLMRFAHWLFSTGHITLSYRMEYSGVDIRKLSPGHRGIVLLLLYLALDDLDDRPLIIDQPEENLDPKSVQDELVNLFVDAKTKRQVIMVTHNANLVVNADADQIIIAEARNREQGSLPDIVYTSGGLENADIRKAVCDILEGGERAFRERARRLRVSLLG